MDKPDSTSKSEGRRGVVSWWPGRILGPAPGLVELNLACWGLFVGFIIVPLLTPVWIHLRAGDGWSYLMPCDFIYFYGIGRIVNEYPLSRLYEYSLLLKTTDEIFPLKGYFWGPSPYPPYVALFFSLFARIPFLPAYLLWMATSLALYATGIALTIKGVFPKGTLKTSLVFCFALGFYPFFICTLKNGQLSALAEFSVGLAIALERRSKLLLSGLALSILAYKPTLLLLVVPMLLITRRFRTLAGFITGVSSLVLIATSFGGIDLWRTYYLHSTRFMGQFIASQGQSVLQLWEYVDFHSFSYAIPGGKSLAGLVVLSSVSIAAAATLAVMLWRSYGKGKSAQDLAWAATLTWTLLLNLYVPVWDATLVAIAVILTFRALGELGWGVAAGWVTFLALLMFAVTWNVVAESNRHGSQLMTILLFIFGWMQLVLLHRVILQESPREKPMALAV